MVGMCKWKKINYIFQACFRFRMFPVGGLYHRPGCRILILMTGLNQKLSQNQLLASLALSFSSRSIWKQDCCGHFIIVTYTEPPGARDISPWCWEEHCRCISSDVSWHLAGLVKLSSSKIEIIEHYFLSCGLKTDLR